MERILVGLDLEKTSLWAAVHALNLAKRISDDGDYLVRFRRISGDVIEKFAKHRRRRAKREERERQLALF